MLQDMLDQMASAISEIERVDAVPEYAHQLLIMKPAMVREAVGEEDGEEHIQWAAEQISFGHLSLIKEIPWYVRALTKASQDTNMEPAFRAAIVGSLAYLVQDRDLIPDDLPAGFGLLDDCMLLHVTACECLEYLPRDFSTRERERLLAAFLALAVPDQRLDVFRETAEEIRQRIFYLGMLEPSEVEETVSALTADPLGADPHIDTTGERAGTPPPPGPDYFIRPESCGYTEDGELWWQFAEGTVFVRKGEVMVEEKNKPPR